MQIAHTTPQRVIAALRELDGDDVDALVRVGTNLAAIRLCAAAEQFFAKPVLTDPNATTYWDALRRSGIQDRVHGYGTLPEKFERPCVPAPEEDRVDRLPVARTGMAGRAVPDLAGRAG